ncbi:MAG: hypothetical protein PHT88_01305 [Candidatus Moranbacteria bacterium]|nr:hypothetical protein [Candidatus Moranbacteria bacterium]
MTEWLDCVFLLLNRKTDWGRNTVDTEDIARLIETEIKRAQPLPLIRITDTKDCLGEIPPRKDIPIDRSLPGIFNHTKNTDTIQTELGIHTQYGCEGKIFIRYSNDTSRVATCEKCGLQIIFPKEIQTYGELRNHFTALLEQKT